MDFPSVKREQLKILQVNLGYKCNQTCEHCHVNAGPNRNEMMNKKHVELIPKIIEKYKLECLDITGGAPELHPEFKSLITQVSNIDCEIIDRCNLTIFFEKGHENLPQFLAENKVTITASLPCYEQENVDKQRGNGVFQKCIRALKLLNRLGYGMNGTGLKLNLVYNPIGPFLPPNQVRLESKYRAELYKKFKIRFSNLYTITNMPIQRFAIHLKKDGKLDEYNYLLQASYNSHNLSTVMCRSLISVDWQGNIYDCDFNQQLNLPIKGTIKTINDLLTQNISLTGSSINVKTHCFGCTAGTGSSCSGSLT